MRILRSICNSMRKSQRIRRLQLRISPPNQSPEDMVSQFREILESGEDDSAHALEEFLDLCVTDEGVQKVMTQYDLDREDLKRICVQLTANGLGQWIKGHYAAASSVAYFEPLLFAVESERREVSAREVAGRLLLYWEGKMRQGELIKLLEVDI